MEGDTAVQKTSVIKLDVDLHHEMEERYHVMDQFVKTRYQLLEMMGYHVDHVVTEITKHGYHVIIVLKEEISVEEAFRIQFLLGDDIHRVNFNFSRLSMLGEETANYLNLLFTSKYRIDSKRGSPGE